MEPDEFDPPAEKPPAATPPDDFVPLERPPRQDEEDEEEEKEEEEEFRLRFGSGPAGCAGTASESRNTSPRMCSAFWAGTPDGAPAGCVNTTCNPVAVTVISPDAFAVPANVSMPEPVMVVVVLVLVVPV